MFFGLFAAVFVMRDGLLRAENLRVYGEPASFGLRAGAGVGELRFDSWQIAEVDFNAVDGEAVREVLALRRTDSASFACRRAGCSPYSQQDGSFAIWCRFAR